MLYHEEGQRKTDELWARIEQREQMSRFATPEEPSLPVQQPKRYRAFVSAEEAANDPIFLPLMEEEDEREERGEAPRFSLL